MERKTLSNDRETFGFHWWPTDYELFFYGVCIDHVRCWLWFRWHPYTHRYYNIETGNNFRTMKDGPE